MHVCTAYIYTLALLTVILIIHLEHFKDKIMIVQKTLHLDKIKGKASLQNGNCSEYVYYTVHFSKYLNMSKQLIYHFNIFVTFGQLPLWSSYIWHIVIK